MKAVRYVGNGKKLSPEYLACLEPQSEYIIIDTLPDGGNVTLRAELDGRPVQFWTDTLTRDFLDLAALVYVVDEVSDREKAADHWTRQFDVMMPVADPDRWRTNQQGLATTLRTLAGDDYSFAWTQRPNLKGYGNHRARIPRGYDGVCLFSGGIDSFLGAYRLLGEDKKLLLVGHQADGTAASAQTALVEILRKKFPNRMRLVQFRVARSQASEIRYSLPKKCEETHRPRSLLFLALAIAVANEVKVSTVYIPENGLIALNPPLGKNRLGTLSTRTAHPKYLNELADFLNGSGVFTGAMKNPFLFQSKTDMLRGVDASLKQAVLRSVSCARPSRYKNLNVRHCGYCVPCIYRRIAFVDPGLDNSDDYAFDIFGRLSSIEITKQLDFRSLVAFAKRFNNAGRVERELVLFSHGSFPLSVGERFGDQPVDSYTIWREMLERWCSDFLAKLASVATPTTRNLVGL
jgi:7-cyano-7-deazaguanine synthase in queuosine biosynthesis